jgi:hypothetical protein
MTTEAIIIEALKTIGPPGATAVGMAYVFLKYYGRKNNTNGNEKSTFPCPLHKGIDEAQKTIFSKLDKLEEKVSGLPLEIWKLIQHKEQ